MTQQKSPGGNQGKKQRWGKKLTPSFYPVPRLFVNGKVSPCIYRRQPTAKRRGGFCSFTGENLTSCPCDFFTLAEVPHA